jgi:hypothetical protein
MKRAEKRNRKKVLSYTYLHRLRGDTLCVLTPGNSHVGALRAVNITKDN